MMNKQLILMAMFVTLALNDPIQVKNEQTFMSSNAAISISSDDSTDDSTVSKSFFKLPESLFYGSSLGIYLLTSDGCKEECTRSLKCIGWTETSDTCELFAKISDIVTSKKSTSYLLKAAKKEYTKTKNYSGVNTVLFTFQPGSLDCSGICDGVTGCVAYGLDSKNLNECTLYSSTSTDLVTDPSSTLTLFTKRSLLSKRDTVRRYITVNNVDFPGTSIGWDSNMDIRNCSIWCSSVSGCVGFISNKVNVTGCWIKSQMQDRVAIVSGRDSFLFPSQPARNYISLSAFTGNSTSLFSFTNGINDCSTVCDNIGYCKGYSIDSTKPGSCIMQSNIIRSTNANSSSTIKMYVSVNATEERFVIIPNIDFLSNDITFIDAAFDQCATVCTITLGCRGYMTIKDATGGCSLKSAIKNPMPTLVRDTAIYIPASTARKYAELVQFTGSQTTLFTLFNDIDNCGPVCDNTASCMGYSIDTTSALNCNLLSDAISVYPTKLSSTINLFHVNTLSIPIVTAQIYTKIINFSGSGDILQSLTGDVNSCSSQCDATKYCVGFSRDSRAAGTCVLRSTVRSFKANPFSTWTMFINNQTSPRVQMMYSYSIDGYLGCFTDIPPNILPSLTYIETPYYTGVDTISACKKFALKAGADYYGLQGGISCFTGSASANLELYGPIQDESFCTSSCGGGVNDVDMVEPKCGGFGYSSIFTTNVIYDSMRYFI